jgi:hypothetical protein
LARAQDVAALAPTAHPSLQTIDKGHGRVEVRRYWTISDPAILTYLDPTGAWAGLRSIGLVEAERRIAGKVSVESRYYLSSLGGDVRAFAGAVRDH